MTLESLSSWATVVTTIVFAATAIAAIVQIRQLKLATQLEGFLALHREYGSPEMYAARQYVAMVLPQRLRDEAYRAELVNGTAFIESHPELILGNFWEKVGSLVSTGMLEPNLYLDMGAYRVIEAWDQLEEVITLRRKTEPLQWASFDHIARLSREYLERRGAAARKTSAEPQHKRAESPAAPSG